MDAPERLTRQYWNRELKLQKISPERTKEFFEAVIGKYYTKPLNLYVGNDGMYYTYHPETYEMDVKNNGSVLDNTGITKKMILDKETKRYNSFNEEKLRKALFNISCIAYDSLKTQDKKEFEICQKWGPLYRENRKIKIQGGPIPDINYAVKEDNEYLTNFSRYGTRVLTTIVSENETNSILYALYGKTDDSVILMFDKIKKEYFIQEEMRSKNYYDRLQMQHDFDFKYIEKFVHIYEKFTKPQNDAEYGKILSYFRPRPYIANLKIIKTGLFQNMLIPNENNASNFKYKLISFDNLQKAYATIIYNYRETW